MLSGTLPKSLTVPLKRWQEPLQSVPSHPAPVTPAVPAAAPSTAAGYLHWCLVMARTRKVQIPTTERAEKRIPMKRKNLSPFNQVLQ